MTTTTSVQFKVYSAGTRCAASHKTNPTVSSIISSSLRACASSHLPGLLASTSRPIRFRAVFTTNQVRRRDVSQVWHSNISHAGTTRDICPARRCGISQIQHRDISQLWRRVLVRYSMVLSVRDAAMTSIKDDVATFIRYGVVTKVKCNVVTPVRCRDTSQVYRHDVSQIQCRSISLKTGILVAYHHFRVT